MILIKAEDKGWWHIATPLKSRLECFINNTHHFGSLVGVVVFLGEWNLMEKEGPGRDNKQTVTFGA